MDIIATDTTTHANEGAVLELRSAEGAALLQADGSPVTITLLGADSDIYVRASNQLTNRALRNRGKAQITAESALTDQINLLAKAVTAWSGIGLGEESTPCTEENAKKLLRVAYIREQVSDFIADRANFTKASPKN
ncbi:hypothetical protein D3C86_1255030 [compost metagenome]